METWRLGAGTDELGVLGFPFRWTEAFIPHCRDHHITKGGSCSGARWMFLALLLSLRGKLIPTLLFLLISSHFLTYGKKRNVIGISFVFFLAHGSSSLGKRGKPLELGHWDWDSASGSGQRTQYTRSKAVETGTQLFSGSGSGSATDWVSSFLVHSRFQERRIGVLDVLL
ncbi:hypothetical protein B0T21DRAFT_372751 [Apiosordaria backusii]|uniref:Uncharacterized protein n=1 Tax=Apiosordaria backusii TaxID=314023 RepID=A0AA40AXP1_9PEZI|nr:hypothetical protein B0T21DRAFT_372751 [Apiosordaria backusii]